jgi:mono/diheme cytochrome c family protein
MKFRHAIILTAVFTGSTLLLSACNFTLAADITPPPGYVSPTPAPTLGALFPAAAPDTTNGAVIYAEKCAPCHGDTGLGDGPQSAALPVTVAALGLPDSASKAIPAAWYSVVTQGNLENFMPPFNSLTDQERWDVVSYALSLHVTAAQIETGRGLFEAACNADCTRKFTDLKTMSALSEDDIVSMIKTGDGAFGTGFTDEEATAVAAYIRTLTFAAPQATPTPAPVTETPIAAEAGTPPAEVTATSESAFAPGSGRINGSLDNQTGSALPTDLKITLRGFEHGVDTSAGPAEILTLDSTLNEDGTYLFENIEFPENRIYLVEIQLNGITYQSEFLVIKPGMTEFTMAPITVYATTEDYSVLNIEALQYYFDYANETNVQILAVYSITNPSDKVVVIKIDASKEIPFIKMPNGMANMGYETSQDSARLLTTTDGFAMPPTTDKPYGLIALATIARNKKINIEQLVVLPVDEVMLLVPAGVSADGANIVNNGPHDFQGRTFNMYTSTRMNPGDTFSFTLSGKPENTAVNPDLLQNQNLVIGIGALGFAFIVAGAWLYWRDRRDGRENFSDDEDDEYDDAESVLDAIVAIDDLHREGKISDEAYRKRRAELKNSLKRKG